MRVLVLLLIGVVVGWAASDVDWNCSAEGDELPNDSVAAAALPNPAEVLEAPASDNPRRPRQWPRRVFETRVANDANGNLHPVTVSRLVNADGSVVPETPFAQQPPYIPPADVQNNATALAHSPVSGLVGRFQASAYGSPSGHGCYVVDTMTGKTWHVANGQQSHVVTEALVQQAPTHNPLATPTYNQPAVAPTPSYYDEPPRSLQKSNVVPTPSPELAEPEADDAN